MREVFFAKNLSWVLIAMLTLSPAWAQTVATPNSAAKPTGHVPTRMQRCESEVAGLTGADRKRVLRECLVNRNEGERIVSRNCFRQFRDLPSDGTKVEKAAFMKQCVTTSLKAGHDKLPDRKPASAPVAAASGAAKAPAKAADGAARPAAPANPALAKPTSEKAPSGASAKPAANKP